MPAVTRRQESFQSTHPLRGETPRKLRRENNKIFQSTHPLRGATILPRKSRRRESPFQSTHPLRGATCAAWDAASCSPFQSTHPLRGATCSCSVGSAENRISIHAPLAGCDPGQPMGQLEQLHFNPRTPCGVRLYCTEFYHGQYAFQSTHPLRGATLRKSLRKTRKLLFQSTHPLRGATRHCVRPRVHRRISIHAPLAGCDPASPWGSLSSFISIHAPLAGCDRRNGGLQCKRRNFNPRTPCGVRPACLTYPISPKDISIHAPLAGCDAAAKGYTEAMGISIHAPLAGCDGRSWRAPLVVDYFNPRTPCGVRPS